MSRWLLGTVPVRRRRATSNNNYASSYRDGGHVLVDAELLALVGVLDVAK